jgi:hypothetical protein
MNRQEAIRKKQMVSKPSKEGVDVMVGGGGKRMLRKEENRI